MPGRGLQVATLNTYRGFWHESLVARLLRARHGAVHCGNLSQADLVLRGPFADASVDGVWSLAAYEADRGSLAAFRAQRRQQRPRPGQVWLQVSGEAPGYSPIASFAASLCDFGIGHEWLPHQPRYCHLPHWMEGLDWSGWGVPPSATLQARLGRSIAPQELLLPIAARHPQAAARPWSATLISTHWLKGRAWLLDEVSQVLPVRVLGRAASHGVADHNRSGFAKQSALEASLFALCPETALHPGYCTEKVVDAFACGAIPLGWFLPPAGTSAWAFNPDAVINLHHFTAEGVGRGLLLRVLSQPARLQQLLSTPLLHQPPDLAELVAFVDRVVAAAGD